MRYLSRLRDLSRKQGDYTAEYFEVAGSFLTAARSCLKPRETGLRRWFGKSAKKRFFMRI
jgi:hypothetical protein